MFDDLNRQSSQSGNSGREDEQKNEQTGEGELSAPTAPKQQVEDMFAETDKDSDAHSGMTAGQAGHSVKPDVFKPKHSEEKSNIENDKMSSPAGSKWAEGVKKYTILGIIVLAVIAVLSGGWYAYSKFFAPGGDLIPADNFNQEKAADNNNTIKQENGAGDIKEQKQEAKPIVKPADKDHDGLSDEEEIKLGTNPNNVDSDSDGLFDREEVRVYKTDPLNPDTDGDGYSDGEEVKKGYNPNGSGKLYKIN